MSAHPEMQTGNTELVKREMAQYFGQLNAEIDKGYIDLMKTLATLLEKHNVDNIESVSSVSEEAAADAKDFYGRFNMLNRLLRARDDKFAVFRNMAVQDVLAMYEKKLEKYGPKTAEVIQFFLDRWLVRRGMGRFGPSSEYLTKGDIMEQISYVANHYKPEQMIEFLTEFNILEEPLQTGPSGIDAIINDLMSRQVFMITFGRVEEDPEGTDTLVADHETASFIMTPNSSEMELIRSYFKQFVLAVQRRFVKIVSEELGVKIPFGEIEMSFSPSVEGVSEGNILEQFQVAEEKLVGYFLHNDEVVAALAMYANAHGEDMSVSEGRQTEVLSDVIGGNHVRGLKGIFENAPVDALESVTVNDMLLALSQVMHYEEIIAKAQLGEELYNEVMRERSKTQQLLLRAANIKDSDEWREDLRTITHGIEERNTRDHYSTQEEILERRKKDLKMLNVSNYILFYKDGVAYEIDLAVKVGNEESHKTVLHGLSAFSEMNASDIELVDYLSTEDILAVIDYLSIGQDFEQALNSAKRLGPIIDG